MNRRMWRQNTPRPPMLKMVNMYLARMRAQAKRNNKLLTVSANGIEFIDTGLPNDITPRPSDDFNDWQESAEEAANRPGGRTRTFNFGTPRPREDIGAFEELMRHRILENWRIGV